MSDIVTAAIVGFMAGAVIAAFWALWLVDRRADRYKQAAAQVTVTPEVLHQVSSQMVKAWLEANGYCWMPKGKEFKWPHEVRR